MTRIVFAEAFFSIFYIISIVSSKLKINSNDDILVSENVNEAMCYFKNTQGDIFSLSSVDEEIDRKIGTDKFSLIFDVCRTANQTCNQQSGYVIYMPQNGDSQNCLILGGDSEPVFSTLSKSIY
jgi:hypothetical protein